jgi:hypothetical protein
MPVWWVSLLSVIVGAVIGFCVSEFRDWRQRKRTIAGYFEALAVEIQICGELARGYVKGRVRAPSYRLPVLAYQKALPELLSQGELTYNEKYALVRFYMNANQLNFCMEQIQTLFMRTQEERPDDRVDREHKRALLKAGKIQKDRTPSNFYDAAMEVVRAHLSKNSKTGAVLAIEDGGED